MYRVLFITDDAKNKRELKSGLNALGFTVTPTATKDLFNGGFSAKKLDVLIADLDKCAQDPIQLCKEIRKEAGLKELPLLVMLTEAQLKSVDHKAGYEDYITLPLSVERLAARLKFLMWRLNRVDIENGFVSGDLVVDFERYEVHVKGALIDLTYKEFELLKFLILNPGRVFSREALLDRVWGYDYYGGTRTVDVHVRRLRSKIEVGGNVYIDTVRNVGYKFLSEV